MLAPKRQSCRLRRLWLVYVENVDLQYDACVRMTSHGAMFQYATGSYWITNASAAFNRVRWTTMTNEEETFDSGDIGS